MNIPTLLYLNDHYCESLEDLQNIFKLDDIDKIKFEILASYRDGIISSWLSEGDNQCQKMAKELRQLDALNLGNSDLFNKLSSIINPLCKPDFKITYNLNEYADYLGCTWMDGPQHKENKLKENDAIIITDENLSSFLSIKYNFKIVNPETERLKLYLLIKDNIDTLYSSEQYLRLDVSRNSKQSIEFIIPQEVLKRGKYNIILKIDESIVSRLYLVYKMSLNLHFGDININLIYIKGNKEIRSFYMSDTPISDHEGIPITGESYNEINKTLSKWYKHYDVIFRLPSKNQWMYAAKGGVNADTFLYSGSNNIDEVAWYEKNTISRTYYGGISRDKQKVRMKKPNTLGLYDMSGNVREMTEDKVKSNPQKRIVLGGSYMESKEKINLDSCTSAIGCTNDYRDDVGFRIVCLPSDLIKLIEVHPEYFITSDTTSSKD